jgi:NitT/TauT family transport system permease protein
MTRAARYRLLLVGAAVLLLELLCRTGVIDRLTMQPPSEMVRDLAVLLASGSMNGAMLKTFINVAVAAGLAVAAGIAFGVALHGHRAVRQGFEPLFATYYAIPVYAFYPLFIILFGLGDTPQILIGFMLAVVAVIVNTLNGLDHVSRAHQDGARLSHGPDRNRAPDHPALGGALAPYRGQARRGLRFHRRHRRRIHHVAHRHRL